MDLGLTEETMGTKRLCQSCAAKYYDFDKDPIVCPSCGTEFDPEAVMRSRRGRGAAAAVAASKEEAETAEAQLEDAPDLDEEADDIDLDNDAGDDATLLEDEDDVNVDEVVDVSLEDDVDMGDDFGGDSDDGTLLEDDEEDLGDHGLSEVEFGDNSEDE